MSFLKNAYFERSIFSNDGQTLFYNFIWFYFTSSNKCSKKLFPAVFFLTIKSTLGYLVSIFEFSFYDYGSFFSYLLELFFSSSAAYYSLIFSLIFVCNFFSISFYFWDWNYFLRIFSIAFPTSTGGSFSKNANIFDDNVS